MADKVCERCSGPLDSGEDPFFVYACTITNTETGKVETVCDRCGLAEVVGKYSDPNCKVDRFGC